MVVTVEEVILRLLLAILIGGMIGYEREFKNRAAGFRTHILVCIGATVISLIQLKMAEQSLNLITNNPELAEVLKVDFARLGAQVITGVGFLGAGTIIHTKGSIRGLTTAASLWVVACLGLGIGMGYYEVVIVGGIGIFITLVALKKFQSKFIARVRKKVIRVNCSMDKGALQFIEDTFHQNGLVVEKIEFLHEEDRETHNPRELAVLYTLNVPKFIHMETILSRLSVHDGVLAVSEQSGNKTKKSIYKIHAI
ncbi:MAG: MgtC/SapB family protein [Clostridium sp.]